MRLEASLPPWGLTPLAYISWMALTALALLLLSSALLLVKRGLRAPKARVPSPSRQGEAELADALHLLDAVMEKLWRRLQQLERKRGEGRALGQPGLEPRRAAWPGHPRPVAN
ncbi:uncharacterized protein LOC143826416 [Paroedura picta]|uniref:uncharacterized protein LOC143826416 n=1 Tax=Paroedura picta TaxID=143630 RepID=UPI004056F7C9